MPNNECGDLSYGGHCTAPAGHNMGRADVPENHQIREDDFTHYFNATSRLSAQLAEARTRIAQALALAKELHAEMDGIGVGMTYYEIDRAGRVVDLVIALGGDPYA